MPRDNSQHGLWNQFLEAVGFTDSEKAEECTKNYKAIVGEESYNEKKEVKKHEGVNIIDQFNDRDFRKNQRLQNEQINRSRGVTDKDEVYDNQQDVRDHGNWSAEDQAYQDMINYGADAWD